MMKSPSERTPQEHDAIIDKLTVQLAESVDGVRAPDVATAAMGLVAFSLISAYDTHMERKAAAEKLITLLATMLGMTPEGWGKDNAEVPLH
jgi:hypothetical protein